MEMLIAVALALLPGFIAEVRKHRHVMFVTIVGFAALWFGMLPWLAMMVYATIGPKHADATVA
jgi:hypothetical protein